MANPPLTKKKKRWSANRDVTLKGTRLSYNAAQQARYEQALRQLVRKMADETKKQVTRLFRGEIADDFFKHQEEISAMDASLASKARILMNALTSKFTQLFTSRANPLATAMVEGASKASKSTLHSSLEQLSGGLSLKTGVVTAGQEEVVTALVAENVSLIKSIPQQYFKDVTGSVMRSITTGQGISDLIPDIQKYDGQTYRRAKNLALDQTRKAYNNINKQRLVSLGVKQFEWIHSGGGQKPRESHIKISGRIFSFDNIYAEQAALGVPESDRGIPGEPINCRCVMKPVIRFETDED